MANKLAQDVGRILSGTLGDFMAQATLKKNCDIIGATPDTLDGSQLPLLAKNIEKSVSFFSGKEASSEVARKILALQA